MRKSNTEILIENINVLKRKHNAAIAIFPIGVPGSGKSFFLNTTNFPGWKIVSADLERQLFLKRQKKKMILNKKFVFPDPKESSHVFAPELRDVCFKSMLSKVRRIAKKGDCIIVDQTNVHLQRVYFFNLLRKYNYTIVAVVFPPKANSFHARNVLRRSQNGGLDLAGSDVENKIERRVSIIIELKKTMRMYLKNLGLGHPKYNKMPILKITDLKSNKATLAGYLNSLTLGKRKIVKKLLELDRVDMILEL